MYPESYDRYEPLSGVIKKPKCKLTSLNDQIMNSPECCLNFFMCKIQT